MNSTDISRADELAGELFDRGLPQAAAALRASGRPAYFPLAGAAEARSYFESPCLGYEMGAVFDFPGGGEPEGLVDALAAYWTAQGESGLAALAPRLKAIAAALREEAAETSADVDILCYTMF